MEKDNGICEVEGTTKETIENLSFPSSPEAANPSFEAQFVPDCLRRERMFVPKSFVKNMEPGEKATMLDVNSRLWPVMLTIYPGCFIGVLSLGFGEFARDNSLKLGDVCAFKMIMNTDELLLLEVSITRGSGVCSESNGGDNEIPSKSKEKSPLSSSQPCKKMKEVENFTQNTRKGKSKQSMAKENGTVCLEKPSSSNPHEAAEKVTSVNPFFKVVSITRGSSVCSESNGDNEIPSKRKEKSTLSSSQPRKKMKKVENFTQNTGKDKKGNWDDLFFSIVMHTTHLTGDFRVALPSSFTNKYLTKWRGRLTLHSEDGKTWPVGYVSVYMKKRIVVRVCRGWKKFAVENHLEVGDKCVFEAIADNATELKVVICRKNQDARPCPPIGNSKNKDISFGTEFTTVNPYFKVTLGPNALDRNCIIASAKFMAKYKNQSLETAMLQVENKVFAVKILSKNRFSAGVSAFVGQNSLKAGDVCYFELIDRATMLLKVSIFRKP